ncbi:uncharacterized protein PHACADRAFT_250923 [Phanerochaete carnosa HHB-10118-sp]|uniref:Pentacotripeptide-repeat region of PRORP domain-containing protein n=1 Tax=Phanerochaete carnosa (strain HHB-10118-sp) TaxID=650164 RepID=K5WKW2_PHACS|nr:uncharacterized protein PHACADRAFT_250923 [Phanerochaete carnosa HHB-10118-sp]EKM60060.1 hypothetical protein PHACADRAFT_250923 [Phanerochaete carnosa HHB-10118-sp]
MKKAGPKPDVSSFNAFMKYYSCSKDLKAISGTMREMDSLGMYGDVYTASVLLPALHLLRTDATQLVLELLRQNDVTVDTNACDTLLEYLVRSDNDTAFDAAFAVIEHMEAHVTETAPGAKTYGTVLRGIERRVWSDQTLASRYWRATIKKMNGYQQRDLIATSLIGTLKVIEACCENPTARAIRQAMIYYRMHKQGKRHLTRHNVDHRIWSKLMDHVIRRHEWKIADELARDIEPVRNNLSPGMIRLLERARARDAST